MKFEKIYIDDFGIIRNQVLEDLSPGINVIGGLNRAGKTTFTKLLRSFGYGISRGDDMPPANIEYRASADIDYDGIKDKILLSGYAKPKLTADKDIESVYGIDYYTYSRLFTIDLDELKKADKEQDKLQYVLLGGGFKEIVKIPSILKEIEKEAEKIGGKTGSPNTKEFKPYYNNIKNQLKIINEASEKLKEYEGKSRRLSEIEEEEKNLKAEIGEKEDKRYLLELIKSNFDTYLEIKRLENLLEENSEFIKSFSSDDIKDGNKFKNNYLMLKAKFKKYKDEYELIFGSDIDILDRLLSKKEEIININMNASGIKNRLMNSDRAEIEIKQAEQRINQEIISLNADLLSNKEQIKSIKGDSLSISKIENIIEEYNNCLKDLEVIKSSRASLNSEKSAYENLAKEYKEVKNDKSYLKYMMANVFILILGSLVFIYNKYIGSIISMTGVIAAVVYMYTKVKNQSAGRENYINISEKYQIVLSKIDENEMKERKLCTDLTYSLNLINDIKISLKMSKDAPISSIKTYYLKINEINKMLYQLDSKKGEEAAVLSKLSAELKSIYKIAGEILGISVDEDIRSVDGIFKETERLSGSIVSCENYKTSEKELSDYEKIIRLELNITEGDIDSGIDTYIEKAEKYNKLMEYKNNCFFMQQRLKSSMESSRAQKLIFGNFMNLFDEYSSENQVEENLRHLQEKLNEISKSYNSLKDEKSRLLYQISELNSYEKIDQAKINIAAERKNLEPLAKSYASYRAAAFILENIQKSFMEETKDKLLSGGSRIFNQLTSGKYNKIMPEDNILSSDFKVEKEDGSKVETSKYLSRATSEQLFLSVRLSRLMELSSKLPVILDDSFVNFDSINIKSAVNVLNQLSLNNQIFILTCHGELVNYISEVCKKASFYCLEEGKFRKSQSSQLIDYLTCN
ncbi:MAG: hypothetical protein WCQ54_08405 [Clostridiaceae bacterium]